MPLKKLVKRRLSEELLKGGTHVGLLPPDLCLCKYSDNRWIDLFSRRGEGPAQLFGSGQIRWIPCFADGRWFGVGDTDPLIIARSEEHTSELQSPLHLLFRL